MNFFVVKSIQVDLKQQEYFGNWSFILDVGGSNDFLDLRMWDGLVLPDYLPSVH